jgi:hypothetical protein
MSEERMSEERMLELHESILNGNEIEAREALRKVVNVFISIIDELQSMGLTEGKAPENHPAVQAYLAAWEEAKEFIESIRSIDEAGGEWRHKFEDVAWPEWVKGLYTSLDGLKELV